MYRRYGLFALAFAALALSFAFVPAFGARAAQQSAPPTPDVPNPSACQVAPRTLQSYEALAGKAGDTAAPAPANQAAYVPPAGKPADEATVAAVTSTVREALACLNAGDELRYYALVTDNEIRNESAQFGSPTQPFLAKLAQTPVPGKTTFQLIALIGVKDVQVLPDGRVGALVVQNDGADPRPEEWVYVIFAKQGDRWLMDEIHYEPTINGTPAP